MTSMQQEVTVSVEDVNLNELLLTGKTDLNWTIDGKPQEALELSYVMQPEGEPEKLFSFIPAYYEQALVKREIEGYKQMKEENWQDYVVSKRTNDLGDVIYLDKFGEIRYDEATVFTEEAVYELMNRISSAFGIGGSEVGELYDNWKQEYYVPPLSTTSSSPQLGWFPNPASVPGIVPPPAAPVVKHEPEFGVVVANKAQVHSSTVNALSSGKFINEGEQLDLSFRQYIVLFHNDDYNRNEAVQLRQQLRDLIPGVDVVMLPMNE